MKRPIVIGLAGVVVAGIVVAAAYFTGRPTFVSGDPWDYNLTLADLPEGWQMNNAQIETPFDLEQADLPSPTGLLNVHSVQFSHQTALDVFDLTSQVLMYSSESFAHSALTNETMDEAEWDKLPPSRVLGDEAMLWRLKAFEDAPDQATYRLDVRYLNSVISVGATGTREGMPSDEVVLGFAAKVLERLQSGARPAALNTLGERPDLRGLLLTQSEIANIDPAEGNRWVYNSRLSPSWTPNSAFPDPAGMDRLGRLVGYQAWLIKPLAEDELKPDTTVGLFQQVTVFRSAEDAQATLEKMVGLESGAWQVAPNVGAAARGWTQVFDSSGTSAGPGAVAATEVSFWVGRYTASVRVQTSAVSEADAPFARTANELLGYQLAVALAANLENAENQGR